MAEKIRTKVILGVPYAPSKPGARLSSQVFVDPQHFLLPHTLRPWAYAMENVDEARPSLRALGHLIPPPRLFVTVKTTARLEGFLENWLRIRIPLYASLKGLKKVFPLSTQQWRDYLGGAGGQIKNLDTGTKVAGAKASAQAEINNLFEAQGVRASDLVYNWTRPIKFCDQEFGSVADVSEGDLREIFWEMYEVGFQTELLWMDRRQCPGQTLVAPSQDAVEVIRRCMLSRFTVHNLSPLRSRLIPDYLAPAGFSTPNTFCRAPTLEAFRILLSRWPGVPDLIRYQTPLTNPAVSEATILAVERTMAQFYVQMFWESAGRPPLVPHVPPASFEAV